MAEVGHVERRVARPRLVVRMGELCLQLCDPTHSPANPWLVRRGHGGTRGQHRHQHTPGWRRCGRGGPVPDAGNRGGELRCRGGRARSVFAPRGGRSAHAPDPHAPHRPGRLRAQPHVGQRGSHRGRRVCGVHGTGRRAPRNGPTAAGVGEGRPMDLEQGPPSASSAGGTRESLTAATQRDPGGPGKGMEADLPARRGTSRPRLSMPSCGPAARPAASPASGSSSSHTRRPGSSPCSR